MSDSMQWSYGSSLKHLIPFFGEVALLSVTKKKLSKYKVLRKNERAKPATINTLYIVMVGATGFEPATS
jgi:CRISPR/Cas system-associated protein endoribonuclease Cas2